MSTTIPINASAPNTKAPTRRWRNQVISLVLFAAVTVVAIGLLSDLLPKDKRFGSKSSNDKTTDGGFIITSGPTKTPLRTNEPTNRPTSTPSQLPSPHPSAVPSLTPTISPSASPVKMPTHHPTKVPTAAPTQGTQTTIFYAIGDAPYNSVQAVQLKQQMANIPSDAEFVIHVGDLRYAGSDLPCKLSEYQDVAATLRLSWAPVLVIPGDNDYNDCPDPAQGLSYFRDTFVNFENHWNNTLNVYRPPERNESFYFVHKGTLFIGLNMVGGRVQSRSEWTIRLTDEYNWVRSLMLANVLPTIIFAHADPRPDHDDFYVPFTNFLHDELKNERPVMLLNGDGHYWNFQRNFRLQDNWYRIMVTGGTSEPPLKVMASSGPSIKSADLAFDFDRRL